MQRDVVAACCWQDGERVVWLSFAEEQREGSGAPGDPGAGAARPETDDAGQAGRLDRLHQADEPPNQDDMQVIVLGSRHRLGVFYGRRGRALTEAQKALLAALADGRLKVEAAAGDMGKDGFIGGGGVKLSKPRFSARFRRPSGVATARRRLQQVLAEDGFDPSLIQRVVLASAEAMNNAVLYAGGGRIAVYVDPDELNVVVTDEGPGIAFDKLARTLLEPRDRKTVGRGHGYWLMVTLSAQCRVFSGPGGTRVELVFELS
ncbi:ATP-binding region ATPase domain protein [Thermaerobacter marianensis DSM 12885]|uniref:ATP-binding region ATPase domain protein n=1 Tax=Thermaerobacter marianensis (strain ATCC 700841 / DSM 12885 / JCM 10246 / 7p75a) TaxID=644966 RepID=E6SI33_THEM7|nr:ATP-binding protein [Thermaerobacter marianensis]ADU50811.1 ATP-binding region ATPase domain protein [Thermaerobacter marianensis DSM 12885]